MITDLHPSQDAHQQFTIYEVILDLFMITQSHKEMISTSYQLDGMSGDPIQSVHTVHVLHINAHAQRSTHVDQNGGSVSGAGTSWRNMKSPFWVFPMKPHVIRIQQSDWTPRAVTCSHLVTCSGTRVQRRRWVTRI